MYATTPGEFKQNRIIMIDPNKISFQKIIYQKHGFNIAPKLMVDYIKYDYEKDHIVIGGYLRSTRFILDLATMNQIERIYRYIPVEDFEELDVIDKGSILMLGLMGKF